MKSVDDPILICDRNRLAEYFGLTVGRITQLTREGVLIKLSRGRYDAPACIENFIAFKLRGGQSSDVNEARKKLYDAQTHKTELETARVLRETIPADEHITDMIKVQQIFNDALDRIDIDLADELSALTDPPAIADRLTMATNAVRQAVADDIVSYAGTLES